MSFGKLATIVTSDCTLYKLIAHRHDRHISYRMTTAYGSDTVKSKKTTKTIYLKYIFLN